MPWIKVDNLALALLRKILDPNPNKRLVLDLIVDHKWCNMLFENSGKIFDFRFFEFAYFAATSFNYGADEDNR